MMIYKKISFIFILFLFVFNLLTTPILVLAETTEDPPPPPSAADNIKKSIVETGGAAGLAKEGSESRLPVIILRIVRQLLTLLGTIFTLLIMYGGFLWMTAGGNEENITKAKKILQNAVIGLLIVGTSYAVTIFILSAIEKEIDTVYF